jgi:hypothetical protein
MSVAGVIFSNDINRSKLLKNLARFLDAVYFSGHFSAAMIA